jgi:hypothetical protein
MSTSVFVGALDSETLHFPANGTILQRTGPLLANSGGASPVNLCGTCKFWARTPLLAAIESEGNGDMSYHCVLAFKVNLGGEQDNCADCSQW